MVQDGAQPYCCGTRVCCCYLLFTVCYLLSTVCYLSSAVFWERGGLYSINTKVRLIDCSLWSPFLSRASQYASRKLDSIALIREDHPTTRHCQIDGDAYNSQQTV